VPPALDIFSKFPPESGISISSGPDALGVAQQHVNGHRNVAVLVAINIKYHL